MVYAKFVTKCKKQYIYAYICMELSRRIYRKLPIPVAAKER